MSRISFRFVLSLFGVVLAGCAAPPEKPASDPDPVSSKSSGNEAPDAASEGTSVPAANDPASLLAAQTSEYARAMEAALEARAGSQRPLTDPVEPSPFAVAKEFRLEPTPGGAASVAQVSPKHQRANPPVAVVANQPIELPVGAGSSRDERPAPSTPTPAPSSATAVEPVRAVAPSLEQQLQQRLHDYPDDLSAHLDYQMLLFLRDEPVPNLSMMSSLPAEDRELITAFMDGMSNFRNAVRADANMLLSRKIRPLVEMADRLRSRADLGIPTLALCRKVEGFGRYDPIEPLRFVAGKTHPVIIYTEVENFSSQLNDGKMWETKLSQDAVLYTETGLPVWSVKTESFSDLARNRRRDFFVVKLVNLPDNLVIGRYLLKVTIIDQQANRVAEASLPLQVIAR